MQAGLNLVHRLLYQPSPPHAPAPSACWDRWQRAVHCVGLGTSDETTLTLPIPIHQPLPATRYLPSPRGPRRAGYLVRIGRQHYVEVGVSVLHLYPPLRESVAAVSVLCCPPRCCWGLQSGSVGRQGGGTCVESIRLRSALPGQPISGQNRFND